MPIPLRGTSYLACFQHLNDPLRPLLNAHRATHFGIDQRRLLASRTFTLHAASLVLPGRQAHTAAKGIDQALESFDILLRLSGLVQSRPGGTSASRSISS
jgi:hypothetical protein